LRPSKGSYSYWISGEDGWEGECGVRRREGLVRGRPLIVRLGEARVKVLRMYCGWGC
jgi:hypothetical protein